VSSVWDEIKKLHEKNVYLGKLNDLQRNNLSPKRNHISFSFLVQQKRNKREIKVLQKV
jgi:hypothetical protein